VSTWIAVLAWLGLALGLFVALQVLILLNRVLQPLREIKRYADDILEAGLGITRNLDGLEEIKRTRELVQPLPQLLTPLAKERRW
jgi:hypothetical protein